MSTGAQQEGVGQNPGQVANNLRGLGIELYSVGIGNDFSKPQVIGTASYPGYAYFSYHYEGKNNLGALSQPLADDILQGSYIPQS